MIVHGKSEVIVPLQAHHTYMLNLLKPNGHYMYQQFNIHKFYILPAQCIYVFCIYITTNSDFCLI